MADWSVDEMAGRSAVAKAVCWVELMVVRTVGQ